MTKERYAFLKLNKLCVQCTELLGESWDKIKCRTCNDAAKRRDSKYRASHPNQMTLAKERLIAARKLDRDKYNKYSRTRYIANKLLGLCVKCSRDIAPDSLFCHSHDKTHKRSKKLYYDKNIGLRR